MTTTRNKVLGIAGLGVVIVGALVWFFLIRDTSPAEFDIDDASSALTDPAGDDTSTAPATTPDGTWTVDADFVAEDGTRSEAGYRVDEVLSIAGQETEKAVVGRTTNVTGTVTISGTMVTEASFTVDMASIATDDDRRDSRYRSALEVDTFPEATFVLTEPIDLGTVPGDDETVSVVAVGDLTIHGVTRPTELALDAVLNGERMAIVGRTLVVFADHDIVKPTAAIVVSLADEGLIEFQVFMTKSSDASAGTSDGSAG